MNFIDVRDAVIETLGDDMQNLPADRQFRVVGYQSQAQSAKRAAMRSSVQIYYSAGEIPKGSSGFVGNRIRHNVTLRIDFTVAGKAKGDLTALQNASTPAQKMAALETFQEASYYIDEKLDQLWSDVWNILMDAKNETFGLPVGACSSRWVGAFSKNDVSDKGEIVTISASSALSLTVNESVLGVAGIAGEEFDVTLNNINNDVEQKTGVAGELGES